MVCLRNISINTLHKGDDDGNDDNDDDNNNKKKNKKKSVDAVRNPGTLSQVSGHSLSTVMSGVFD